MSTYERIKSNPEAMAKRKAYHAQWQRDNKDKVKAYNDACRAKKKQPEKYGAWISVEDRLPEVSGKYLCYGNAFGRSVIGVLYYCIDIGHFDDGEVTHWMQLPEPPDM